MKKIKTIFLIIIIVLFAIVSMILANNIINKETKYAKKLKFEDNDQLLAIFYLGGLENEYDYSIINKYYSDKEIEEFEKIELEGEECYLIVPRYAQDITISSLTMTEDGGTLEKSVIKTSVPFLLKCNVSDIFSNAEIKFNYRGKDYKYSPYISLKDGSVVTEDFVLFINE